MKSSTSSSSPQINQIDVGSVSGESGSASDHG